MLAVLSNGTKTYSLYSEFKYSDTALTQGLSYELLFDVLEKSFYCQVLSESFFSIQ